MPLLQAVLLTPQARLAYGRQLVALYEKQTGQTFIAPKRREKAKELMMESPSEVVEQILKHLRVLDQFPVGEPTRSKAPEQKDEYAERFEEFMGFLMGRLDLKKPLTPQVGTLIKGLKLENVHWAIMERIRDEDTEIMKGKLQDHIVKHLSIINVIK